MELEQILTEIKENGYKKIGIQVPEGLKKEAILIAKKLKVLGSEPFISSSACFGACDLAYADFSKLECDCLIHVGHSKFSRVEEKIPTFYYEKRFDCNVVELLKKGADKIKENKIGLAATIQHVHELNSVKDFLESNGKIAIIGKRGKNASVDGQVLGCDNVAAEKIASGVDCFIFVGSGNFHPMKLSELGKRVYQLNPFQKTFEVFVFDPEKKKQKEILKLLKYQNEKNWGILLSSKPGQFQKELSGSLKKFLESKGKNVFIFIADRILESDLIGFGVKIFLNTACPRLSEDFKEVALVNPWVLEYLE